MGAKQLYIPPLIGWLYDLVLWSFSVLVDLFFREVHPRGSWKIPRRGPLILVAAPHANQFVDSLILMRVMRNEAHRRISWLIADKSFKRKFIGTLAKAIGTVPVARAMDNLKPGVGTIYLPDPINQPTLLRGVGTNFEGPGFEKEGTISLPTINGTAHSTTIAEIRGPEELILKKPFKAKDALVQLTGRDDISDDGKFTGDGSAKDPNFKGSKFKVSPHVDQTAVYQAVFGRLNAGGCVGIFPEGGSHDRPDLLPLKAGVALMALGTLADNPGCGLKIVPCGMNYFHAHKFRSRAVIEFGNPIEVPREVVDQFRRGERREAVGALLDTIYQGLVSVTVTSPDFDTLMVIQAARRLYNTKGKKLPLPMVVELNRRLVQGYTHFKDDPRVVQLRKSVANYNQQIRILGIRDHQVEYAKFSWFQVICTLIYRLGKLALLTIGTLPGLLLFAPVFIATKSISNKKSREALAASTVKLQGRDVMATWKLLVALAFAPAVYASYTAAFTYLAYRNRIYGFVPDWMPLWMIIPIGMILFPTITFAALRIGEVGMDIVKSLRPLVLSLNPSSANSLLKLRERRAALAQQVTEVINTLGPELFPDFDAARIVTDPFRDSRRTSEKADASHGSIPEIRRTGAAELEHGSPSQEPLPRNESFHNLANIGFFSTRPSSRTRSRSSSSGGRPGSSGHQLKPLSPVTSKDGLEEVSSKIRDAMRERGERRRRRSEDGSWDMASSGSGTPSSEENPKDL
ncbi:putative glycerol-3-phosphate acyltransferase Sct1 [Aspergillus clavatus NRRL 1]|uniref:Glycerol-3-phosphate acyltransferase Sct1, putative n=1 Tax=Aspergillus clavatus (strain ATCC 1007 / CBS 513.65 / DSM 816 / NCTC 3887 / NRRL 1 / QM 1276 / 107) TaxID=344612 RepID=A1CI68_ASPCL|nr:glycerol-3-phosphate acyltransferase Sct1, putative [Aspergillus clavatus NRRL 1]EAW10573.1 glycerol-3-phosphate acyltransferase Sct1, putative [Aspergillus clavatus NRRL 1]